MVIYTYVGIGYFFICTEVNGSKKLHGINGTSKEFALDITVGNLKKEKSLTVDSFLDPTLAVMNIYIFILNLK